MPLVQPAAAQQQPFRLNATPYSLYIGACSLPVPLQMARRDQCGSAAATAAEVVPGSASRAPTNITVPNLHLLLQHNLQLALNSWP
jgi:hypothetical protein